MINTDEYIVTSFENKFVPFDSKNPNSLGLKVKKYILIENPQRDEYKKCVEFEDGTAVKQLVNENFCKTKIKTNDGKWHLLQYANDLFEYNNVELMREAEELPRHSVVLKKDGTPELLRYLPDCGLKKCKMFWNFFSEFPEEATKVVENAFQLKGLSKNEANNLRQIFGENLSKVAIDLIEKGQELIRRGSLLSESMAKLHIK